MTNNHYPALRALVFLAVLIATPIILYWPGLSGDFLLDDFSNLENLEYRGDGIQSWDDARFFIFEGVSSPLGRPVAVASFLLDAQSWPAPAEPFKYTNIMIHTLSSVILFAALLKLFQVLERENRETLLAAMLGALIWAIHPFQTSTVLYVIQRMTEMSALFAFAGLWCYLHGRLIVNSQVKQGYAWMTIAVVICGALSVLSKENGILLPSLLLVLECTLLNQIARPPYWRAWAAVMLVVPSVVVLSYLGKTVINYDTAFNNREYTLYERLLTQSRILMDYIGNFFLPTNTPMLFHDDLALSKGLLSPYTTLLSTATILALISAAILFRKKHPFACFAVLWFFVAHALESTVLSLELYYEHRNYLPYAGLAIAAGYYAVVFIQRFQIKAVLASSAILVALCATTWQYTTLWGDNFKLLTQWHKEHPTSVRTAIKHGMNLMIQDRYAEASALTNEMVKYNPLNVTAHVFRATVLCVNGELKENDYYTLANLAANHFYDSAAFSRFKHLHELVRDGYCTQISKKGMINLIDKLLANPYTQYRGKMSTMGYYLMKSEYYSQEKMLKPTIQALDLAYEANPIIDIQLKKASILIATGFLDEAEKAALKAQALDAQRGRFVPTRQHEIDNALYMISNARKLMQKLKMRQHTQTKTP